MSCPVSNLELQGERVGHGLDASFNSCSEEPPTVSLAYVLVTRLFLSVFNATSIASPIKHDSSLTLAELEVSIRYTYTDPKSQ